MRAYSIYAVARKYHTQQQNEQLYSVESDVRHEITKDTERL